MMQKIVTKVISVSVPTDFLEGLDAFEKTRGCGRSRLVTELIGRFLDELAGVQSLTDGFGAHSDLAASHKANPTLSPLDVVCPNCGAGRGERCATLKANNPLKTWHFERALAYDRERAPLPATVEPLDLACPHCDAEAGKECVSASGRSVKVHVLRRDYADLRNHNPHFR